MAVDGFPSMHQQNIFKITMVMNKFNYICNQMKNKDITIGITDESEEIKCSCGQIGISRQAFNLENASSSLVRSTNRSVSLVDIMRPYATQINRR